MNFEEYLKTMPPLSLNEKGVAKTTWNACKNEALRVLKDNTVVMDCRIYETKHIKFEAIKEIENL